MKDYFKAKTWYITILMFVMAFGLSSAIVYYELGLRQNVKTISASASASDNVNGWAWNANIGWVSFNCTDTPKSCSNNGKPCLSDGECTGGNSCVNTCDLLSNYGVSVDLTTGHFSGYAWSSSVGWVSFNRRTCAGGSDVGTYCATNNECSSNSCRLDGPGAAGAPLLAPYNSPASLKYNAIYDFSTSVVTGWGKILTMGDNGWIKFNDTWANGVSIDQPTGNFSGWAWNANTDKSGIGWLSFNCSDVSKSCKDGTNQGAPCPNGNECLGGGSCVNTCTALSNYKVIADINRAPSAIDLTAPNWSFSQAGQFGALKAKAGWTFSDPDAGQNEYAYQIIVNTSNSIVSPVFDSDQCFGYNNPSDKCKIDIGVGQFPINSAITLNYNTPYYWWVKVWDDKGADSGLTQFDTSISGHVLTDNQDNNPSKLTFTTYMHKMPIASPTCFPQKPSRGEKVKCTANSQRFFSAPANPAQPENCSNTTCSWLWTIPANAIFDNQDGAATSTPTIIFNSAGLNKIELKVTDLTDTGNTPYYSEFEVDLSVSAQLPKWKEVKPE